MSFFSDAGRFQKRLRIGQIDRFMAKEKTQIERRLFNLKDAASYLGRPVYGVRSLIWSGKLPVIQDGRKMYVDVHDLENYITRSKTTMV
jgi:hypothetical protein